jgi:hypothetical protein
VHQDRDIRGGSCLHVCDIRSVRLRKAAVRVQGGCRLITHNSTCCVPVRRYYHPRSLTISIVGDVTPEQVQQLAEKYFGGWSPAATMEVIPLQQPEPLTFARPGVQVGWQHALHVYACVSGGSTACTSRCLADCVMSTAMHTLSAVDWKRDGC